jgi:molecular chaperone GrpE
MKQEKKKEVVEEPVIVENQEDNKDNQPSVEEVTAEPVDDWKEKYTQLNDTHLRLMAEFDNYRKRTLREKSELIKTAGESVLINLLPLADDFERGMQLTKDSTDVDAVRQGLELIYSKLIAFLQQNGVKPIDTANQVFDTEYHEAITTIPSPTEELKGKVIDCVQKGYLLNDKVIRFAKVVVGE